MAFNNCNSETNGEKYLYSLLKDKINTIYDVGCRYDSLFLDFPGEVHYFDPISEFIEKLKIQPTFNRKSYYNIFGLGQQTGKTFYFPSHQSFINRVKCCGNDEKNKIELEIKTGLDYLDSLNSAEPIDFIKIDTEGYELDVLQGFGDYLTNYVKVIQFEYGGTYLDRGIKLQDVISYLEAKGFGKFSYLSSTGMIPITDTIDHYRYCNIVCINTGLNMNDF